MSLVETFAVFLKAALLSFGGLGSLPLLHDDLLVQRDLLNEEDFARALAVGRITPGPNGLYVTSLGYFLAGVPGAIAASLAVAFPALLSLPLDMLHRRFGHLNSVQGLTEGLGMAVVGMLFFVSLSVLQGTVFTPVDAAIALAAFLLLSFTRLDAALLLALAGLLGLVLYR